MVFKHFMDDPFFQTFFFDVPRETRPPSEIRAVCKDRSVWSAKSGLPPEGLEIVYALAGFSQDNIKVWSKQKVLFIEGDATGSGNPAQGTKFGCYFKHQITMKNVMDLGKIEVTFENGLLKIFVPTKEDSETEKMVHFGK